MPDTCTTEKRHKRPTQNVYIRWDIFDGGAIKKHPPPPHPTNPRVRVVKPKKNIRVRWVDKILKDHRVSFPPSVTAMEMRSNVLAKVNGGGGGNLSLSSPNSVDELMHIGQEQKLG